MAVHACVAVLALVLLASAPAPAGAIGPKQADAVAKKVLRPELRGWNRVLYRVGLAPAKARVTEAFPDLMPPGVRRGKRAGRLRRPAYLYMLDGNWGAMWAKPTWVVAVDRRSGRVAFKRKWSWWPVVNGRAPAVIRSWRKYVSSALAASGRRSRAGSGAVAISSSGSPATASQLASGAQSAPAAPNAPTYDPKNPLKNVAGPESRAISSSLSSEGSCLVTIGEFPFSKNAKLLRRLFGERFGIPSRRVKPGRGKSYPDGKDLDRTVDRMVAGKGCEDVAVYITGHGAKGAVATGPSSHGRGIGPDSPHVSADDLAKIIGKKRKSRVTFKVKIDSCYAASFDRKIKRFENLLIAEYSSAANQASLGIAAGVKLTNLGPVPFDLGGNMPPDEARKVTNVSKTVPNPHISVGRRNPLSQVSEFTYAELHGLVEFAKSQTEVKHAVSAPSFMAWMLGRSQALGSGWDIGALTGRTNPSKREVVASTPPGTAPAPCPPQSNRSLGGVPRASVECPPTSDGGGGDPQDPGEGADPGCWADVKTRPQEPPRAVSPVAEILFGCEVEVQRAVLTFTRNPYASDDCTAHRASATVFCSGPREDPGDPAIVYFTMVEKGGLDNTPVTVEFKDAEGRTVQTLNTTVVPKDG